MNEVENHEVGNLPDDRALESMDDEEKLELVEKQLEEEEIKLEK